MTIKSDQHGFEVQAGRPALSQTIAIGAGNIVSAPFQTYSPQGSYSGWVGVWFTDHLTE